MPGGDGTGPYGAGPMTGGGFGYCGGRQAGPVHPFGGLRGRFGGRGWRHRYYATGLTGHERAAISQDAPQVHLDALRSQATWLEQRLADIRARIDQLTPPAGQNQAQL